MALKMTNHQHDAEDLLHDSFLKALRKIGSLAEETSARAWMYTILRNTFVSGLRIQARAMMESMPGNEMHRVMDLVAHSSAATTRVDVARAVEELDENFRKPVLLCDVLGMTYAEAAREIGCPIGTLMSRLSRARDKLREILEA